MFDITLIVEWSDGHNDCQNYDKSVSNGLTINMISSRQRTMQKRTSINAIQQAGTYVIRTRNHAYSIDKSPSFGVFGKQKTLTLTPFQAQILC